MLKLCLGFLVDTLFCVWIASFIHADILVLVSEYEITIACAYTRQLSVAPGLNLGGLQV